MQPYNPVFAAGAKLGRGISSYREAILPLGIAGGIGAAGMAAYNMLKPEDDNDQYRRQGQDAQWQEGKNPVERDLAGQLDNYNGQIADLQRQQLDISQRYGERAGTFKRDIERDQMNQGYYQQLGMQNNRQGFQREMQGQEIQARQAGQLLDGYLQRIQGNQQFVSNLASLYR